MKSIYTAASKRASTAFVHLVLLTLVVAGASCKRSEVADNANAAGSKATAGEISTTPPFSTKEPERFQAKMVIHGSLGEGSNIPGMTELKMTEILITRDGERRRVDTELFQGMKVSYLQLSSGLYLLVPEKKIYTEFKLDGEGGAAASSKSITPDFSPDKLLNQSPGGARYEKLGTEEVNGRATVKYRVTTAGGQTGEADSAATENLIWIDEALGMPVKSETTTRGGTHSGAKYSMELRDIKQDVDPSQLELPADYKKVDYRELTRMMTDSRLDSMLDKGKP